jgi:hypothetical protein
MSSDGVDAGVGIPAAGTLFMVSHFVEEPFKTGFRVAGLVLLAPVGVEIVTGLLSRPNPRGRIEQKLKM